MSTHRTISVGKWSLSVIAVVVALIGTLVVTARLDTVTGEPKSSATIEQCANESPSCDASNPDRWIRGNLGTHNSLYLEGQSVPYRAILSGLTVGETYAVRIGWDSTLSSRQAFDYLTTYDASETAADPCAAILCSGDPDRLAIPVDADVAAAGVTQMSGQFMSLWGGRFVTAGATVANVGGLCTESSCSIAANPAGYARTGDLSTDGHVSVEWYFTALDTTAVMAWGGHISSRLDWGTGSSAIDISGSPYHMRLVDFRCSDSPNCSVGNQDLSLSSAAVVFPGSITIEKRTDVPTERSFDFTAGPAPLGVFSLLADGTSASRITFGDIVDFQQYVIDEVVPAGWRLADVSCSAAVPYGGGTTATATGVVIDLAEGESVTCVFTNADPPPPTTTTTTTTVVPTSTTTSTTSTTSSTSTTSTSSSSSSTSTTVAPTTTVAAVAATTTTVRRTTTTRPTTTTVDLPSIGGPALGQAVSPSPSGEELPSTGDESSTTTAFALLLVSTGALALVLVALRRILRGGRP